MVKEPLKSSDHFQSPSGFLLSISFVRIVLDACFSIVDKVLMTELYATFWDIPIPGYIPIVFGKLLSLGHSFPHVLTIVSWHHRYNLAVNCKMLVHPKGPSAWRNKKKLTSNHFGEDKKFLFEAERFLVCCFRKTFLQGLAIFHMMWLSR